VTRSATQARCSCGNLAPKGGTLCRTCSNRQTRCACGNMAPKGKSECAACYRERTGATKPALREPDTEPDWSVPCEVCGSVPTMPATGLCGPCTFGESETAGGNW
jgi:hypothetical protein